MNRSLSIAAMVEFVSVTTLAVLAGCTTKTVQTPTAEAQQPADETPADTAATCEAQLDGDCGTCMKSSCCEALTACEGDPDCAACVNAKDSDACEKTTATHERVDAYLTCKGGGCATACIATQAGSCTGLVEDIVPQKCTECLEKSCCEEVTACHGADVCWDGCFQNHDESKCHGDPDAHALYHAMGACVEEHCAAECE